MTAFIDWLVETARHRPGEYVASAICAAVIFYVVVEALRAIGGA